MVLSYFVGPSLLYTLPMAVILSLVFLSICSRRISRIMLIETLEDCVLLSIIAALPAFNIIFILFVLLEEFNELSINRIITQIKEFRLHKESE